MNASPSSALSAEAKEFVPLVQSSTSSSIPLYVDENSVASIYPSDQGPLMIQSIYPMMISHSKVTEICNSNHLLPFPEIEFHIQPSQQQQFHIDSCASGSAAASSTSPSTTTSQIVLLPTSSSTGSAYYPAAGAAQILYASSEGVPTFYPLDYCEQPLINFSLQQQSTLMSKSNRISSQLTRPSSSFRQQHGNHSSSYRSSTHRAGGNRNSYYDYHPRRNGTSYPNHTARGGNASNSKRISSSSSYHHYYHQPTSSSRSRGYSSARSAHYHDEQRKDLEENDYSQTQEINDDETPFEFRPEDFPSLPIHQPADKTPSQALVPPIPRSASSWNEIVSAAPRPHSTSPSALVTNDQQRSDRSRSFNNTKISTLLERKSSTKKSSRTTQPLPSKSKSPLRASKTPLLDESPDGFIQTKQQQRRLKRKNRMKEDFSLSTDEQHSTVTSETSAQLIDQVNQIDLNDHSDREPSSTSPAQLDLKSNETDRGDDDQNSARLSSNSTNSSDTSDYDDAVDSLVDEQ